MFADISGGALPRSSSDMQTIVYIMGAGMVYLLTGLRECLPSHLIARFADRERECAGLGSVERPTMGKEARAHSKRTSIPGEPKWWRPVTNPIPRFLAKVRIDENGCWEWTAARYPNGYCVFRVGQGETGYAHRWLYLFFVGEIPEGYVVDHLCRNTGCVNPDHLEPVPQRMNHLRGRNPELTRARYRTQTHCKRGHPFDEENTYHHPNGRRVCKTCSRQIRRGLAESRSGRCRREEPIRPASSGPCYRHETTRKTTARSKGASPQQDREVGFRLLELDSGLLSYGLR
jgi:hypothetical protein